MEMKGDFLGFTFIDKHSDDFGIIRVSDGNRYKENLQPEIKDIHTEVPGMDGEYYFGTTFGVKNFDLDIAFDSINEKQLRDLKRHFGQKRMGKLIFDEEPYKYYWAKIESPIELSYVCFDEVKKEEVSFYGIKRRTTTVMRPTGETERIYKGDGTISFICYYPYAKSEFKVLPTNKYDNINEWASVSGILDSNTYSSFDKYNEGIIKIYNAGDIATGFRLYTPIVNSLEISYISMSGDLEPKILKLDGITQQGSNDIGFVINTDTGLIQGVSSISTTNGNVSYTTTGTLYNRFIVGGYFFKLEPNFSYLDGAQMEITGGSNDIQIFYDYLYF